MAVKAPSSLDGLTVALLISSVLYLFCLVLSRRKWAVLNQSHPSEFNTKKLLVLSVGLVCLIRIMSFAGVAALNMANVRAHYSMSPATSSRGNTGGDSDEGRRTSGTGGRQDKNQAFYDGAMTVLFDLPNGIVVSSYVLLTLVWAECFLQSRFHTENTRKWHARWLGGYTVFNTLLYGTQMILYILIFALASGLNAVVRMILYAALTGINFSAVFMVMILYIYLNLQFSGYPFRSPLLRKSFGKISALLMLWSIARLIWAVAMLLVYIYDIELLQDSDTPRWSFLLLFLLFVVCEIIPIIGMLDYSYMNIIGFEHNATNEMNALASGQRSEARPQVQGTSTDSQNISLHSKRERSKSAGKYVRFRMDDPTFDSMSSDPTQPLLKDLS